MLHDRRTRPSRTASCLSCLARQPTGSAHSADDLITGAASLCANLPAKLQPLAACSSMVKRPATVLARTLERTDTLVSKVSNEPGKSRYICPLVNFDKKIKSPWGAERLPDLATQLPSWQVVSGETLTGWGLCACYYTVSQREGQGRDVFQARQ